MIIMVQKWLRNEITAKPSCQEFKTVIVSLRERKEHFLGRISFFDYSANSLELTSQELHPIAPICTRKDAPPFRWALNTLVIQSHQKGSDFSPPNHSSY
jgi:hypothetical protein